MAEVRSEPRGRAVKTRGPLPPVTSEDPRAAVGRCLIRLDELDERGVTEVRTAEHGVLAVGMAAGAPFAVSNVCRHQFAKLGRGRVTADGCLECPWHRARFDVREGTMTTGPKGRVFGFKPYSLAVRAVADRLRLTTYAVELRDDAIWLLDDGRTDR